MVVSIIDFPFPPPAGMNLRLYNKLIDPTRLQLRNGGVEFFHILYRDPVLNGNIVFL